MKTFHRSLLYLLCFALILGCSSHPKKYGQGARLPQTVSQSAAGKQLVQRKPWENFTVGRNFYGVELTTPELRAADLLLSEGKYADALVRLISVQREKLSPADAEALTYRVASTQLVMGQPKAALGELSQYFRNLGVAVDSVDPRFAVLFGYAYDREGDVPQSLAWFSRAQKGDRLGVWRSAATDGAKRLLQSLPAATFEPIREAWSADIFIAQLAGEEARRRAEGGGVLPRESDLSLMSGSLSGDRNPGRVQALIPLSGKFAVLGTSVKNGTELALTAGSSAEYLVELGVTDVADDVVAALSEVRDVIVRDKPGLLVGPLISETATPLSELARSAGIPIITFSKQADFVTGPNVLRLGLTTESQVHSLIREVTSKLKLQRCALLFPHDAAGIEYAEHFRAALNDQGLSLVFELGYDRGADGGLLDYISELEASEPDALIIPDSLAVVGRFLPNLPEKFRSRITLLGTALWDNFQELSNSRTAFEGAIFPTPFFAQSPNPVIASFVQSYQSRYGKFPDFLAAQAFDATSIALRGLPSATTTSSLSAVLAQMDPYAGLTGTITVEPSGELHRVLRVVRFSNGTLEELSDPAPLPTLFVAQGDRIMRGN